MDLEDVAQQAIDSALAGQLEGIFALVFFFLGFASVHSLIFQLRIRGWPTTSGTLLQAQTSGFGATEYSASNAQVSSG